MSAFDFDDLELRGSSSLEDKETEGVQVEDSKESDFDADTLPSVETYGSEGKTHTPPVQVTHLRSPYKFQKHQENGSDYGDEIDILDQGKEFNAAVFQSHPTKPSANYMACSAPIGIPSRWTISKATDNNPPQANDFNIPSTCIQGVFIPPYVLVQQEDKLRQDFVEAGLSPQHNLKREKLRMRNKILTMTGFAGPEESQASTYLRHVGRPPKLKTTGGLSEALNIPENKHQEQQFQQGQAQQQEQ